MFCFVSDVYFSLGMVKLRLTSSPYMKKKEGGGVGLGEKQKKTHGITTKNY